MTVKYRVIFDGNFSEKQVQIEEVTSTRKISPKLEKDCVKEWRRTTREAEDKKQKIWEGQVCRFEDVVITKDSLVLKISTIPFSIRLAMNAFPERLKRLGRKYFPLGMFTSCFVFTSDQKFIFIQKSDRYYTHRKKSFVGGVLSKIEKELKNGVNLFEEVKKEIIEEVGLEKKHISDLNLKAGYVTENHNFCLVFQAKLSISSMKVDQLFRRNNDGEAQKLFFVKKDKLAKFAATLPTKDLSKFDFYS